MDQTVRSQPATTQLGFWSAVAVTLMLVVFPVSLLVGSLNIAYLSSFLLAPAFVALMASIHHYAPVEKKVWSQLGLAFATIYAVLCSATYYIQLTAVQHNNLRITEQILQPFVFVPGTPIFAQDMLGYAFFCLATLAAGPVFVCGRLETLIRWLFVLNGVLFAMPALILPTVDMPTNASGTGQGDQIGVYANLVWSTYFAVTAALVAVLFKRRAA